MIKINNRRLIIGVDIGGSHITAGVVDLLKKNVLEETIIRKSVDSHAPAAAIVALWAGVIEEVAGLANISAMQVGFAMPGPFDYEKGICLIKGFNKYEALYNMNIREELAQRLKINGADILFRNDAEAFLDGEIFCGAAIGYRHVIGITLGTGLGSAYSHDGITVDAELSATPYKGRMIEEYVSTRGLLRNYFQLTGQQLSNAKEIAGKYQTEENARTAYKEFAGNLSWFLSYFIAREQPQVLVVGGNISNSSSLFLPQVVQELKQELAKLPEIRMARLGENAAMIGGACSFIAPALAGSL